jgi:hypothetical protein
LPFHVPIMYAPVSPAQVIQIRKNTNSVPDGNNSRFSEVLFFVLDMR